LLESPGIIDAVPHAGRVRLVLGEGAAAPGQARPATPSFEDGFMVLLRQQSAAGRSSPPDMRLTTPSAALGSDTVIEVQDLVRRFGAFTAVDHVSFGVRRGEIFGLLGPNGAGKTTTFRMLCGLLSATSGRLKVAGRDLRTARAAARQQIGYVAQKFSLYGPLSVTQNLEFFASAYGLSGRRKHERIAWAMQQFELEALKDLASGELPGGYKQRLAMAVALLHEPPVLFLDEPTSGADPLARREFWKRITLLGEQGVTVIVTTHFMEEAEYCDRIVILDAGRVLAEGAPAEVRRLGERDHVAEPTMEDAFIAIVEQARAGGASAASRPEVAR
jgi:ABC-2 type transport system ATP-binding protein